MPAQIYCPRVGRIYRIELDDAVIIGHVTAWDADTITVKCDPDVNPGSELPLDEFQLKRSEVKLSEWR